MKKIIYLAILLAMQFSNAQTNAVKKQERIVLINDEIVSMETVDKYFQSGYVKSINNGVSEEKRNELAKKYGDKIGDRALITVVAIYTEQEKIENDKKKSVSVPATKETTEKVTDQYILNVNDKAKDFTLKLIDGKQVKLSELKGKVVLVNFWATWCGPCLMEFNEIPEKIIEPFKNKDFVFLAISRGETEDIVSKKVVKLKQEGKNFNYGLDPDKKIWNEYAKIGIPKNFLIDKNGVIRFVSTGYFEGNLDTIASEISKLLSK